MRGLDDVELHILENSAYTVKDGDNGSECDIASPEEDAAGDRLIARGLVTTREVECGVFLDITPLGRLALRIERAFRSGAALRGGV